MLYIITVRRKFPLERRFGEEIKKGALISPGDKILVAVSGGVDSVVLLDLLWGIRKEYALELKVVHLNHQLRGKEADQDEEFVKRLAEDYGLECICQRADVKGFVEKNKVSIETGARLLRYEFFEEVLERTGFDKLATGHQGNDQAETFLDRLLRGSGLQGLAGIPASREKFIRPLLFATREEIQRYAREKGLPFREDSSNRSLEYRRNRIRWELIPLLEKFNPRIVQTLTRVCQILRENEEYLRHQAQEALQRAAKKVGKKEIILDIKKFSSYFIIVQKYVLFLALELLGVRGERVGFHEIERIVDLVKQGRKGRRVPITEEVEATLEEEGLVLYRRLREKLYQRIEVSKSYCLQDGEVRFSSQVIELNNHPPQFDDNRNVELVDYDRLSQPLILRSPQRGDRFRPLGMKGFKKLSDFFTDEKIPRYLRERIPVLECSEGIVWVCGLRIDDRFKITPQTRRALRVEVSVCALSGK